MNAKAVVKRIESLGGYLNRQVGSHARYSASYKIIKGGVEVDATCHTSVPMHSGDIPVGTLVAIEKAMIPAFGEKWLR